MKPSASRPQRRSSTCRAPGSATWSKTSASFELPLQGRNVTDLIVLAGAVSAGKRMHAASVAGGRTVTGWPTVVDGGDAQQPARLTSNLPLPFPDALQEFSVATGGLSAESGMHSGASVNAVTKSGTNTIRGNVFEFLRDRRFNATESVRACGSRSASASTTAWCATSSAGRLADRWFATSCSSLAAIRAPACARRRPRISRGCRRRQCWPATSPPLRHLRATVGARWPCGRRSSTTGSIQRCSARPR